MSPILIDFETFYSKKLKYGLKTMIPEQYCSDPRFDPYLVSVCDGANVWAGEPKNFNWSALEGRTLLAHNVRFDRTVFNEMRTRKMIPALNIPAWHCTADLSAFLCNRRALDKAVEHLYGVRVSKDARADAVEKHWPENFSTEERAQMIEYAKGDALWGWKIWNDYSSRWPELERRLSNLTINQGMRGVQIDEGLLNDYICQTHEMLLNTEHVIPWIEDAEDEEWHDIDTKPTATKCIAIQCRKVSIPCPPVKSKDEEGYEEWEDTYGLKHPWIEAVGSWRSINKLYKTLLTVKERIRIDGTLPFSLKYFGAHTGRWAGDARVNFQNMRKAPLFCNERGLMEQKAVRISNAMDYFDAEGKWPDWVRYAIDFRALIIPRPGKKMIVSDLAQIEPRVLAWMAGNTTLLDKIKEGYGIYEAFARTQMGYSEPGKMDKASLYYKMIKIQVLGLGYGCGWSKFIKIAAQGGVDLTAEDKEIVEEEDFLTGEMVKRSGFGDKSRELVTNFRGNNPKITALWDRLDDSLRRSVGTDFTVKLPSGRTLRYEGVRSAIKIRLNPKTNQPEKRWEVTANVGHKRTPFYGGKLTENVIQATARDVFAEQLVRMEDNSWDNLFSSHDEAILEVDQDVTAKDVEQAMSHCPEWLKGCPIAAEAKEVAHYLK